MSGLVDTKSLGFRAKRRSAGSKNNVIAVIGQAKPGVFTRCRDTESESLVIRSQSVVSFTPCKAMDRRKDALPPSVLRSLGAAPLISPFYVGFAFPYSFALSAPRELQSGLLSVHGNILLSCLERPCCGQRGDLAGAGSIELLGCSGFQGEQAVLWVSSGFVPNFHADQKRMSIPFSLFPEAPSHCDHPVPLQLLCCFSLSSQLFARLLAK